MLCRPASGFRQSAGVTSPRQLQSQFTDSKGCEQDEPPTCLCLCVCRDSVFGPYRQSADDAADSTADAPAAARYLLRYKFQPGETIRWKVLHQALVRTTVSGTTQTAETYSESVKVWQVKDVDSEHGQTTFVHSVDRVEMRQSVSGRQDIRYNSEIDAVVPAEFEQVAKAVRVPLSVIVLDNRGHITKRKEERHSRGRIPAR